MNANPKTQSTSTKQSVADQLSDLQKSIPDIILDLISPPPVLQDEDEEAYWKLFAVVVEEHPPQTELDWLDIKLIVDERWERFRLDRIKVDLVGIKRKEAVQSLLTSVGGDQPGRQALDSLVGGTVADYLKGDSKAKKEVAAKLAQIGLTETAITAEAVTAHIDLFTAIDRLAQSKATRWQKAEARLEMRRLTRQSAPERHAAVANDAVRPARDEARAAAE